MKKILNKIGKEPVKLILILSLIMSSATFGQYDIKWMSVGSMHNFYTEIGCEIEEGRVKVQQDGWQWPAIYPYQDCQAAKAFWIGVKNFTDNSGTYPYRVVHVGPRVSGAGEFFPVKSQLISKFEPTSVIVDGIVSFDKNVENDIVDPTMKPDRMYVNQVNTLLGITMERKIFQFSIPGHDNYIVHDLTFTNTGNTDADSEIELPGVTLEDVYFFYQYRWAVSRQPNNIIANGTRWGMNTMIDSRGDGAANVTRYNDPASENYRTQFAWHGYFPDKTVPYDNIGAPIWYGSLNSVGLVSNADTVGRLGAPQFVGVLTLHADQSTTNSADDPSQPRTVMYESSDHPNCSNNDAFNIGKMTAEYEWMASGYMSPRHAWLVEPSGNFANQKRNPNVSPDGSRNPGGNSAMNGYGPYTMAPGESIRLVMVEGTAGLGREETVRIGRDYKNGVITDLQKNAAVLTGKDSLMKTWRLATENFNAGWNLSQPPRPPKIFEVNSGGDRISLSWTLFEDDPNPPIKFRVYRAQGGIDSTYRMIHEGDGTSRSFDDQDLIRGISYFYYVEAVGSNGLTSSRYYTQTYNSATLKRPAGEKLSDIRVVPNPFVISADVDRLRFGEDRANQIAFFGIPGRCTIRIYTEMGELIETITHTDGSGDAYWNSVTSSNQIIVSGIYIAVVTNDDTGEQEIVKFAVIR